MLLSSCAVHPGAIAEPDGDGRQHVVEGRIRMRTIMAGHSHRVPQTLTCQLAIVLMIGLTGCATQSAAPPAPSPRAQAALETTTAPSARPPSTQPASEANGA